MKRTIFTFLILMLILAACAPGELTVLEAWARPGLAGNNSAVYFVVDNPGEEDTLLKAATTAAETVEIHMTMAVEGDAAEHSAEHTTEGSEMGEMPEGQVMTMVKQDNVPIPRGQKVNFQPGGVHVMLISLTADLVEGDTIEVTLTFEKAGEITLQVPVEVK
ncbi:MAG: hypothetical protein Fur0022_43260 [Anaerolineales bacterium]